MPAWVEPVHEIGRPAGAEDVEAYGDAPRQARAEQCGAFVASAATKRRPIV